MDKCISEEGTVSCSCLFYVAENSEEAERQEVSMWAVCTLWPLNPNAGQCVRIEEVEGRQLKDLGSQSSGLTDPLWALAVIYPLSVFSFSSCQMSLRFVSLSFVYPQKDPTVLTSLHEVLQQFGWGQISQPHPSLQLVGPHFFRGGIAFDMKTGATGTLLKKKGEAVQPFFWRQ